MSEKDQIVEWTGPRANDVEPYGDYAPTVAALRENPQQWARLTDRQSPSAAYQWALNVRKGKPKAFRPAGAFEGAHEGVSVFVRYLGLENEASLADGPPVEFVDRPDLAPVSWATRPAEVDERIARARANRDEREAEQRAERAAAEQEDKTIEPPDPRQVFRMTFGA